MVNQQRNCTHVLFKDSNGLLTMLLLSQAADSSRPCPRKTRRLDDAEALVRDLSRVTTENTFSYYSSCPHPPDVVCQTFIRTITFRTDPYRAPLDRITLCILRITGGKRGALKIPSCKVLPDGV